MPTAAKVDRAILHVGSKLWVVTPCLCAQAYCCITAQVILFRSKAWRSEGRTLVIVILNARAFRYCLCMTHSYSNKMFSNLFQNQFGSPFPDLYYLVATIKWVEPNSCHKKTNFLAVLFPSIVAASWFPFFA